MTSSRGDIWVGDVARAWSVLGLADAPRSLKRAALEARIAAVLGFGLAKERETPRPPPVAPSRRSQSSPDDGPSPEIAPRTPRPRAPSRETAPRSRELDDGRRIRRGWTRRLAPAGFSLTEGARDDGPELAQQSTALAGRPLPYLPLIRGQALPAIIEAAMSTDARDGDIDIDALVLDIATRERVTQIPRLSRPSLVHGAQLLLDMGQGMIPFRRDAMQLASTATRVIGRNQTEELWFVDAPLQRAVRDPRLRSTRQYRPPPPRTPVLIVSDFGIAATGAESEATPEAWLEFADLLRRRGSQAIAFVPYPATRWPKALAGAINLIWWDRPTVVGDVRRTVAPRYGGQRG